jgi:hypothetical protein
MLPQAFLGLVATLLGAWSADARALALVSAQRFDGPTGEASAVDAGVFEIRRMVELADLAVTGGVWPVSAKVTEPAVLLVQGLFALGCQVDSVVLAH